MTASVWILALSLFGHPAHAQDGTYRVTGGQQAPEGKWNDAVGVYFGSGNRGYIGCTGTLIGPQLVITAAHCADGIGAVLVGSNDYQTDQGEFIEVTDVITHPNRAYDIAVLLLESPSSYEPRLVGQGCVLDQYLYDGAPVAIVGYGATDAYGQRNTSKLMEGFSVVTDHDCSETRRGCVGSVSPGGEIGAGQDGVDACYGDSGGPLYLLTEMGDYVVGVTSRAFYDVSVDCGEGGIWVRPDAVTDWIEEVSGYKLPVPTCNLPPEPTVEPIQVPRGGQRIVEIEGNDPEGGAVTFTVAEEPEHGSVEIVGGEIQYTADDEYVGADDFVIGVTDVGVPAFTVDLTVPVEVLDRRACGCTTPAGPMSLGWFGLLGGLMTLRRRERSE